MNRQTVAGPVYHGGALDRAIAQHGGERHEWLDLSTGINPHAWPVPTLTGDAWNRLPDSGSMDRLIEAARQYYGVPERLAIVATPGTQALIEVLPRILAGTTATIVAPQSGTYREHAHCAAKAGREVRDVPVPGAVPHGETMATLVHPNNPDGTFWPRTDVLSLALRLEGNGGHLVIDEAFCDTDPDRSFVGVLPDNAIALKSFGKFFGLAGVRLGFAIATPELANRISEWFGPWAVGGPALEIGNAALRDEDWSAQMRVQLAQESLALAQMLEHCGLRIAGRNGLFVLARHRDATGIAQKLMAMRILVRRFPDRPELLRFGLARNGIDRLSSALEKIMRELQ